LFSRILNLNDTQAGVIAVIFKYCDDNKMPLLDLKDIKKSSISSLRKEKKKLRRIMVKFRPRQLNYFKVIELEQQGAELFFGEKSLKLMI
jgi:hypothetical protein